MPRAFLIKNKVKCSGQSVESTPGILISSELLDAGEGGERGTGSSEGGAEGGSNQSYSRRNELLTPLQNKEIHLESPECKGRTEDVHRGEQETYKNAQAARAAASERNHTMKAAPVIHAVGSQTQSEAEVASLPLPDHLPSLNPAPYPLPFLSHHHLLHTAAPIQSQNENSTPSPLLPGFLALKPFNYDSKHIQLPLEQLNVKSRHALPVLQCFEGDWKQLHHGHLRQLGHHPLHQNGIGFGTVNEHKELMPQIVNGCEKLMQHSSNWSEKLLPQIANGHEKLLQQFSNTGQKEMSQFSNGAGEFISRGDVFIGSSLQCDIPPFVGIDAKSNSTILIPHKPKIYRPTPTCPVTNIVANEGNHNLLIPTNNPINSEKLLSYNSKPSIWRNIPCDQNKNQWSTNDFHKNNNNLLDHKLTPLTEHAQKQLKKCNLSSNNSPRILFQLDKSKSNNLRTKSIQGNITSPIQMNPKCNKSTPEKKTNGENINIPLCRPWDMKIQKQPQEQVQENKKSSVNFLGIDFTGEAVRRTNVPPRYQCEACNKSYATFSGLSKHKQFHCISQIKKQFSCKFCEKNYVSLGALKMHIRTHTLPCKCHLCGKAFSRPWLLQGHMRTHTGEKPFQCSHCGRSFADRSNLRAHLQTHTDIKKYSCGGCSKTFSRMSLLLKHKDGGCPGSLL